MSYFNSDVRDPITRRFNEALVAQQAREARAQREAEARDLARDIVHARTDLGRGFTVDRFMRLVTVLDRQRGRATVWTTRRGPCAVGTTIYTRPIVTELDALVWAHEYIHATTPCPRTGLHQRIVRNGHANCLACETAAWRGTLQMLPWSRAAADEIARCLYSYLRQTSAPLAAHREARRYTSGAAWRIALHQQHARQDRLEQFADIMRTC